MPLTEDFRVVLTREIQRSHIVLILIGLKWLSIENGQRCIDRLEVYVRFEIEIALRNKKKIIPIFVDNSHIPSVIELPESIKQIAYLPGLPVRANNDFNQDIERLVKAVKDIPIERNFRRVSLNIFVYLLILSSLVYGFTCLKYNKTSTNEYLEQTLEAILVMSHTPAR
jgi:hypothetical protein